MANLEPYISKKSAFGFYLAWNGIELKEFWEIQEAEIFAFNEIRTPYPPIRKIVIINGTK